MAEFLILGNSSVVRPSRGLWADCPWGQIQSDPGIGVGLWDDFLDGGAFVSTDVKYKTYADGGCTIAADITIPTGVVKLTHDGTDNDAMTIQSAPFGYIANGGKACWFEAAFSVSTITADRLSFFIGLAEGNLDGATNTVFANDTVVLQDLNYIGFKRDGTTATTALSFVYRADGQTQVVPLPTALTLGINTFYKVGFKFNPNAPPDRRLKVFVDGSEQTTYVTAASIDAATFPNDKYMGLTHASKIGAATANSTSLDWWRFAQLL